MQVFTMTRSSKIAIWCLSLALAATTISHASPPEAEEPPLKRIKANVKSKAAGPSAAKKRKISRPTPREALGNFYTLQKDIKTKILNMLDIQSIANFERTSRSVKNMIHTYAYLTIDGNKISWQDAKRVKLPIANPQEPWPRTYLIQYCNVELSIAKEYYFRQMAKPENLAAVLRQYNNLIELGQIEYLWHKHFYLLRHYNNLIAKVSLIETKNSIEELIKQGNEKAYDYKWDGLKHGEYGYERNYQEAWELNAPLLDKNNMEALEREFDGFCRGSAGHELNIDKARQINERLIALGSNVAKTRKICGLSRVYINYQYGYHVYEQDLKAAKLFIESLVRQEFEHAEEAKWHGLNVGNSGYRLNKKAAKQHLLKFAHKGRHWAMDLYVEGHIRGINGFDVDYSEVKSFTQKIISEGNSGAITKLRSLLQLYARHLPDNDNQVLKEFNELFIAYGSVEALYTKWQGLALGTLGYQEDVKAAKACLEELVKRGHARSLMDKFEALTHGDNGCNRQFNPIFFSFSK